MFGKSTLAVLLAVMLTAGPYTALAVVETPEYGYGGDPVSCMLYADPDTIDVNGGTLLTWDVSSNVVSAVLSPLNSSSWQQQVTLDGSWWISGIINTRSYTLTVTGNEGQTATCDVLITVEDEAPLETPSCSIEAVPDTIVKDGSTTLEWTSSDNVVSAVLHPKNSTSWEQSVPANGSWFISGIRDTREYSLTVTTSGGLSYICDAPVTVTSETTEGEAPTCDVEAVPSSIPVGGATTLVWTSSDNVVSAKIHPTNSSSFFATVTPEGSWYISGITNTRSYSVTVYTAEGKSATCDAPVATL